jgi:PIN domain nuclease of toxin-antitoxin system
MSSILLDTHIWVWYASGNNTLSKTVRKTIEIAAQNRALWIAAISLWELAMLDLKKRIVLDMPCLEWINKSLDLIPLQIIPLTPAISVESCHLPAEFHGDPADRLIMATARVEGLSLVTRDVKMLNYGRTKYASTIKA